MWKCLIDLSRITHLLREMKCNEVEMMTSLLLLRLEYEISWIMVFILWDPLIDVDG